MNQPIVNVHLQAYLYTKQIFVHVQVVIQSELYLLRLTVTGVLG